MYLRPAAPLPTRVRWLLCGLVYLGVYASLATPVQAGMIGFPAPRLDPAVALSQVPKLARLRRASPGSASRETACEREDG